MAKIPRSSLVAIMTDKIDAPGANLEQLSQELAAYLLSEGRSNELDSLMRDIMQRRADNGTVEVLAHSAFALSDAVRADIETEVRRLFPTATTIIISEVHDPEVVAGVRLELANEQLDLSIRSKLNRFKQLAGATL